MYQDGEKKNNVQPCRTVVTELLQVAWTYAPSGGQEEKHHMKGSGLLGGRTFNELLGALKE